MNPGIAERGGEKVKLPSDVQAARCDCKGAFNLWKQQDFSDNGEVHDVY